VPAAAARAGPNAVVSDPTPERRVRYATRGA